MKIRQDVQAILFDEQDNEKKVLLIRFFDPTRKRYTWRLIKGGVEKNETDEQALVREIMEEVGLKDVKVMGKVYSYEFNFKNTKHLVSSYLVKGRMQEELSPGWDGDRKIVEAKWVSPQEAIKLLYWENEKQAVKALL